MYTIENIINKAIEKDDRLSIIVINEGYDDYIEKLCKVDHDFYVIDEFHQAKQWNKETRPSNLTVSRSLADLGRRYFDFIIVFNRADSYARAEQISNLWHIPIIVYDVASSNIKAPLPFFASINVSNPEVLFHRNGLFSIGVTEDVSKSWYSNNASLSTTAHFPADSISNTEPSKILIDNSLAQQYIESLPIKLDSERFTTNRNEAKIFLNLWQNITPLMIDCMNSRIPVVTFQSPDFTDIINKQACVIIQDMNVVGGENFLDELMQFNSLGMILENAQKYVEENCSTEAFKDKWNSVLGYARSHFYARG